VSTPFSYLYQWFSIFAFLGVNHITTREELAKLAGTSHDTVAKVKLIEAKATEEQKAELSAGRVTQLLQPLR
jgi:hypothetical protein